MRINKNDLSNSIHVPRFNCDDILHEQLRAFPLPNNHHFFVIIGKPRSGKSSLAIAFLSQIRPKIYRKVFNNIVCFVPNASLASLKRNVFDDIDENKKYNDLTPENLEKSISMCEEWASDSENNLMYIDDQTAYLKNNDVQRELNRLVFNRRHIHTSIWLLSQNLMSIPPNLRKTCTHLILFKPALREWNIFCEEYLGFLDKDQLRELYDICFDENHSFLYFNTETNQIYKKFDEVIFD